MRPIRPPLGAHCFKGVGGSITEDESGSYTVESGTDRGSSLLVWQFEGDAGMLRLWTIPDKVPPSPDCFVIPSYALRDRTTPNNPTKAQIELAYRWWKKFPGAKLIMSTGDNQGLGITNASVMAAFATSLGIPPANIIEEDQSLNTYENLLYSIRIIQREGVKEPTLVTLDLYTRRAVATARKLGMTNLHWLSVFAQGEPAYGYKWLQTHSRFTIFCYEIAAMIYSKAVGWT